jgi:ribosome-associated protein
MGSFPPSTAIITKETVSTVISDSKITADESNDANDVENFSGSDHVRQSTEQSLRLALAAARTAEENRGEDIVVLDMSGITPVFDYFVLITGNSRRQLHAISEEIDHCLEDEMGDKRMGIEGYRESRWILLDYGNVVIHIFDEEMREYYALEQFWNQAQRVALPWQPESSTDGEPGPSTDGETKAGA